MIVVTGAAGRLGRRVVQLLMGLARLYCELFGGRSRYKGVGQATRGCPINLWPAA